MAAEAGQPVPDDTYTVATPSGGTRPGIHLYFQAPAVELRNTVGKLGWRIDTRGVGGYVVAAGSVRPEGVYRVVRDAPVQLLPQWLVTALTPPCPPAGDVPGRRHASPLPAGRPGRGGRQGRPRPGRRTALHGAACGQRAGLPGAGRGHDHGRPDRGG
nr:bifunctional DNA primase/polymerase [Longimycelium tulufanense]